MLNNSKISNDSLLADVFFQASQSYLVQHAYMKHTNNIVSLLFLLFLSPLGLSAQQDGFVDYQSEPKQYEIAAVVIDGTVERDENAIKSIAGFREGQKITIPSDLISSGLKNLYKLGLFENVEVIQDSLVGDLAYLRIKLYERPTLTRYSYIGAKKANHDDLNEIVTGILKKGSIVTVNSRERSKEEIKNFYVEKGYLDANVKINEIQDSIRDNSIRLQFVIDKKKKVKIDDITFSGNKNLKDSKLRKLMKGTKRKRAIFRTSRYIQDNFKEDKENIVTHYNKLGFRDAKILSDSVWRGDNGRLNFHIDIEEGNRYYYRNISWKGNSIYTSEQLEGILGINKGDVYNRELLDRRLEFSLDGRDISSLYLDKGYLFFRVDPTEIAVSGDSIDIEMRITEGAQATIDNVVINGNDRTHEHVIRRELRTRPGQKFSRADIIRSQRQITNLGYFNPESLDIQTPVNPQRGTVDVVYTVEERPSDQLELSAGYGGFSGLIGTLGITFNNFSIQNIRDRSTWSPLPQGDGQKLSVRVQSNSRFFRSYNASFTEPWLGGKKPNSFTTGIAASTFTDQFNPRGKLSIFRYFVGLGTQLKKPDDFFISNTVINLERININEFGARFAVGDGNYRNFNINQTFTRSSVNEPIFPRRGSKVSLSIQLTPPYSLFRKDNFWLLSDSEKENAIFDENRRRGFLNPLLAEGVDTNTETEAGYIKSLEDARKFSWLEYHKWRFDAEWYFNFANKFVMMASAKMAYLGSYNRNIGDIPFERFEYGGDGLSNQNNGITGTDIVSARGYESSLSEFPANDDSGGTIFNKFTLEIRYPLSTNPNSTIYAHTFLQAGDVWDRFQDYNPFQLKRAVGAGLRVFLPMFGLLGFDYGWGIDKPDPAETGTGYGKFSIVLGFEPD